RPAGQIQPTGPGDDQQPEPVVVAAAELHRRVREPDQQRPLPERHYIKAAPSRAGHDPRPALAAGSDPAIPAASPAPSSAPVPALKKIKINPNPYVKSPDWHRVCIVGDVGLCAAFGQPCLELMSWTQRVPSLRPSPPRRFRA